jgi:hypothetical protein
MSTYLGDLLDLEPVPRDHALLLQAAAHDRTPDVRRRRVDLRHPHRGDDEAQHDQRDRHAARHLVRRSVVAETGGRHALRHCERRVGGGCGKTEGAQGGSGGGDGCSWRTVALCNATTGSSGMT